MTRSPGWPAVLREGDVVLRPFRMRDGAAWSESRLANEEWLAPWEPPGGGSYVERNSAASYGAMVRALRRRAREGTQLAFAIWWQDRFAGQLTVGNIVRGALHGAHLGYWVDGRYAGRGICPTAVALAVDHCFGPVGLHRVEANVRPENVASRRVVDKLGFRVEGTRLRYLYIDGAYRDHVSYALTTEDVPGGLVNRWRDIRAR
ncbi:MAG TPA: GNAT family protein [Mycobacteriales bacterium]|nr:GNAT family protein [Mycobacteriales bacterium]